MNESPPENRAVYEITWKNILEPGRSQMKVWRMCIACWIPTTTNTHSEYVTLIAVTLQNWLHERASMLRYTYIACLVYCHEITIAICKIHLDCSGHFFPHLRGLEL